MHWTTFTSSCISVTIYRTWLRYVAFVSLLFVPITGAAQVSTKVPHELKGVSVKEHLNEMIPLNTWFFNHEGRLVRLGDLINRKKPVLLNLVYHSCPMLCNMVLDGTVNALKKTEWSVGKEFTAITISFDPSETVERAARKRAQVLQSYNRPFADQGWHFLVSNGPNIDAITNAVGFKYRYDNEQKQYAHPAVVILLQPDGRIARYLYGIDIKPADMRLGLLEASNHKSVSTFEQLLLYCYHYDPKGRTYAIAAARFMQIAGLITVFVLGFVLARMWSRELKKRDTAS